ncbi:hypothetical protein [Kribbella sp. NPDC050459]|uniref:hypothetical protein n=1 Tax=Kribbella sp. NPDC050459 TaxID=3155785 RepID=UPI00340D814F
MPEQQQAGTVASGKRDRDVVPVTLDGCRPDVEAEFARRRGESGHGGALLAGRILAGCPEQVLRHPDQQVLVDPVQHCLFGGRQAHAHQP